MTGASTWAADVGCRRGLHCDSLDLQCASQGAQLLPRPFPSTTQTRNSQARFIGMRLNSGGGKQ
eukprot:6117707-Pyramimonas_sp.AAC.1